MTLPLVRAVVMPRGLPYSRTVFDAAVSRLKAAAKRALV
jgi:hypothetical protein